MRVSVIGGSRADDDTAATARDLGRRLADRGHTVVCGGLGGVMKAVCAGARERDGHTIGILPGDDRSAANAHVVEPIVTGLGHARNGVVVLNGDAVVALDGGSGTLSELGLAGVHDQPTAGLGTFDAPHVHPVDAPADAVDYVERQTH